MGNISRRRFVQMLAGIPLVGVATRSTSVIAERTSLGRGQIEAVESILRRLVDSGAVPGVSYSIGNKRDVGGGGLRVASYRPASTDGEGNTLSNRISQ